MLLLTLSIGLSAYSVHLQALQMCFNVPAMPDVKTPHSPNQSRKNRATLKDVAALSGVSQISVSRVLRKGPHISSQLRDKVLAAVAELGYSPNRFAGSLRGQTSALIAVIMPSMSNNVFSNVVDGIDQALSGSHYRPVLGMSHYDEATEEAIVRDLLSWDPSGVIISGLEHSDATRQLLRSQGCPVIEVMDTDGEPIDTCVGISQREAGNVMAQHFVDRGYKRIGYVGAWAERPTRSRKRRLAFEETLSMLGVPLSACLIESKPSSVSVGFSACSKLLAEHPMLDSIFFANDDLAFGALLYCQSAGINVPDDVALAGYNALEMCEVITPKLTTIQTPREEIGVVAGELLLARLGEGGSARERRNVRLAINLIVGQTT